MLPTRNYSARDEAITQRPTSTALLTIDSEDRFKSAAEGREVPTVYADIDELYASGVKINATPYLFSIEKLQSLNNGFFTRLGVTEVNFPWGIPNINNKTNSISVSYQIAPAPIVATSIDLTDGFYTPAQIASAIQLEVRALDASLVGFTMTYGDNNMPVFTYATNNPAVTIAFDPLDNGQAGYPFGPNTRQLFDLLGFTDANTNLSLSSYGGTTYAQAIRYIDVVCNQLTYNQALKDATSQTVNRDTLCRIYITEPGSLQSAVAPSSSTFSPPGCAPTTIYRNFSQPKQIQWLPNQPITGSLTFEVYDDQGENLAYSDPTSLNSDNKLDWSMTLLLTEN